MAPVALQVLMFFPRGGSAQVVRYLAREIAARPAAFGRGWSRGSLGAPPARPGERARTSSPASTWCR